MTKEIYPNEVIITYLYKWEFLRRNEDYKTDYKKFVKSPSGKNTNPVEVKKQNTFFLKKYHIPYPIDPHLSLLKFLSLYSKKSLIERNGNFLEFLGGIRSEDAWKASGLNFKEFIATWPIQRLIYENRPVVCAPMDNEAVKMGVITIRVNLKAYRTRIMQDIEAIVKEKQKILKLNRIELRKRISVYKDYLRIYDLYRDGKSYHQIAKIVYPKRNSESAIDRIEKNLKAIKRLINKDYRNIR